MNLAHKFPIIFWNTANLIVDSGAEYVYVDEEEEDEDDEFDFSEVDDEEDEDEGKPSTINSSYGKIATAIGKMQQRGIKVLPPSVNESGYTYTLNVEHNTIRYGLTGISRVGASIVQQIIDNRPFTSIEDFLEKVKVNKTQMVSLIKCGAFDDFGEREVIMDEYIDLISGAKKKLTLQNVAGLIEHELFPEDYAFEVKVFNFNKYIKKFKDKSTDMIKLDEVALEFYSNNFDMDLIHYENGSEISASAWKKIYDSYMANLRTYIVNNQAELLEKYNNELTCEVREKYAKGNRKRWSMESVNFYQDGHELENTNLRDWGVENFYDLPEEPQIASSFKAKDGHIVNLFKLTKIAGTVIDKKKDKNQITLLTTDGVVIVQAYGVMPQYDKQISIQGADGKKHVVEKSWFSRGNKVIVNGMRRGENIFVAKKYNSQEGHHFMLITDVDDDGIITVQEERYEVTA